MTSRAAVASNSASLHTSLARKLQDALAAQNAGQIDKAARLYTEVLRKRPNEFDALHLLGLIEYRRGHLPQARKLITAALRSHANSADAWSNLGLVCHAQGDHAQALSSFDRALAIKSDHAEILNNRGTTLNCLGRHDAALESFARALALRPDYLFARFNHGSTLIELGRFAQAFASFEAALALAPNHPDTLCHRGNSLMKLNRAEEALASYARALSLAPDHPTILHNQALALRHLGRPRDALVSAEKSLRAKPGHAPARFEQALALLALGDLPRGFAAYESRWDVAEFAPQRRNFREPLWLGEEAVAGKTMLLHAEQGFGDTLQFVRYVPLLAQRGAKIILEVQPQLKALLSHISGASLVLARGETLPPFDRHCPLMSLPLAFRTDRDTIPANVPYIATDPVRVAHWAARLSHSTGKPKIGLVWAGEARKHNPDANAIDARRSMTLAHFAPLRELTGVQFVSLQKGAPATQALHPPDGLSLLDPTSELVGFEDTAGLIATLDLVISVDTAVAHLAGALGKPVWILSRFDGCWRWLDGREDSPWYPTAHLFHQKAPGGWGEVVGRVLGQLSGA
ncbi:MAG TPA: tetratricopeptide repeat protein [Xanthobacteraceae bacterium]|nr:tetratricopeptide repeat protein [Xanthobacteraceae bacterium]